MGIFWLFFFLIAFCLYILFGLYITEGLNETSTIAFTWVIYTCIWITFGNVFLLAYFWATVKDKTGPVGIRGQSGEKGEQGIEGSCGVTATQAEVIRQINELIDSLYKSKKGTSILNQETQKFPNNYINKKISTIAGSKQYNVIISESSVLGKSPLEIINYIKGIWNEWFKLIYDANPDWFTDEYGDENYSWSGKNPFDEITKYDLYYWGITRSFRPMKAEICRSTPGYESSKLPIKPETRLKIIQTNNYQRLGGDMETKGNPDVSWSRAKPITIGNDTYFPVGDNLTYGNSDWNSQKRGETIVGDMSFKSDQWTGPNMRTLLVSGDVVDPISYEQMGWHGGDDAISSAKIICPDGYESMGDIIGSGWGDTSPNYYKKGNTPKCVPKDCLLPLDGLRGYVHWMSRNRKISHKVLNDELRRNDDANNNNGYNLFRVNNNKPFYRINPKCLSRAAAPSTKDLEPEPAKIGFGWYGHPYKLDPRYSIFTFLGLVPEGMIVNQGNGRRFYIIHYGGEDVNTFIILNYNSERDKFDSALQVDDNPTSHRIYTRDISRRDNRQQWKIILDNDKKFIKLKNFMNNKYLYIGLKPVNGEPQFSSIALDNNAYKNQGIYNYIPDNIIKMNSTFSFISTYGTHMDNIDDKT
jgi:hypothetical protein